MHQSNTSSLTNAFIRAQGLPSSFQTLAERWYLPLARELAEEVRGGELKIVGISGSQGSGKSTLAAFLAAILSQHERLRCIALSMDDFYLRRAERAALAKTVHPLLMTRGVPGTHDIPLFLQTLHALRDGEGPVTVPRFDKALDDRKAPDGWEQTQAPMDIIIVEGWCLKTPPQDALALQTPINELEANEDSDAIWRTFVNEQLQGPYRELFDQIDLLIFLQAPSFASVYRWRGLQEQKLIGQLGKGADPERTMDDTQLRRFIQHFERLTLVNLEKLPDIADIVFKLNDKQDIVARC